LKKILLLSDTHHHIDEQILAHCKRADEIWHAGDIGSSSVSDQLHSLRPLKAVYGNIDDDLIRMQFPEMLTFETEKMRVAMVHIAGPFGKYRPEVKSLLSVAKPDILVCGHSHILKIKRDDDGIIYMNPGAAGHHGFHHVRTMIRFEISEGALQNMEVIELGKRGRLTKPVS
jgi:putative phosphoesterase